MGKLLLQLDFIRQTVWAFAEQQTHYSFMRTTPVDANRCVMRAAHFRIRMQIFFFLSAVQNSFSNENPSKSIRLFNVSGVGLPACESN